MSTRNLVFLVGRLAADPQLRYLESGTAVANFAVAVNRSARKPDGTFEDSLDGFFDCELFGPQAQTLAETCRKGSEVQLSGSLRQKKFQTSGQNSRTVSRIEIRVESIAPSLSLPRVSEASRPVQEAPQPQPA